MNHSEHSPTLDDEHDGTPSGPEHDGDDAALLMHHGQQFTRIQMLLSAGRSDLAEEQTRKYIAEEPDDPSGYVMLGLCLNDQDKHDEAVDIARQALAMDPDDDSTHYLLSISLLQLGKKDEAIYHLDEAIHLNPDDASYYVMRGMIALDDEDYETTRQCCVSALRLDPENIQAMNMHVTLLMAEHNYAEAEKYSRAALAIAPEEDWTHSNLGMSLLRQNKPNEALEHFQQALRLDPNCSLAKLGLAESTKAHNPIYRLMLMYFTWMSKIGEKWSWGIIIGFVVLFQLTRAVGDSNPALGIIAWILIMAYMVFGILTWSATQLFDGLLVFNKKVWHALDMQSKIKGLCALIGVSLILSIMLAFGILQMSTHTFKFAPILFICLLIFPLLGALGKESKHMLLSLGIFASAVLIVGLSATFLISLNMLGVSVGFISYPTAYYTLMGASFLGALSSWVVRFLPD